MHHYFTRIYLDLEDIRKANEPKAGGKKTNASRFPDHDEHVQLSTKVKQINICCPQSHHVVEGSPINLKYRKCSN